MVTVPRLARWNICRCRLNLHQCLQLSRDLYHPPQATLRITLLLYTRGLWERVTSSSTTTGLCLWVSIDAQAQLVHICGFLVCIVSVGVKYACDITTASAMAWLINALLLVWIISPVRTSVKARIFVGVVFFFCMSRASAEPACASIVAIPFISVFLLWLVLCQLVATVMGCSGKGHDPADGSYSECLETSFLYTRVPLNCFKHVHTQISLMLPSWQDCIHTKQTITI